MAATEGQNLSAWRSRLAPVIASLIVVIAVVAVRWLSSDPASDSADGPASIGAPAGLVALVSADFPASTCTTLEQARSNLENVLRKAGFEDWTVSSNNAVKAGECVGATINTESRTILLVPALRPEVRAALSAVADHLFDQCLGKVAATEYLVSTLTDLGESGYQISTQGPLGYPVSRASEVDTHLDNGCWIYSGTGWTADGQRVYFLSGK